MKLREFRFLADENIHPLVLEYFQTQGFSITSVKDVGLAGAVDSEILRRSVREQRVVITHDGDFGMLAILAGEPAFGILYLRPGHIDPNHTIGTVREVMDLNQELAPPFILVAERRKDRVKIRLRSLG